ncbi:MAG: 16S rRNA (uracil(1498)-N(3))-methyltransferase [Planctomycetia bacterium]|nr:16S rRNA (uracil(1498)-N(3))-methyltransferase [Planctomycetia bacterium]
MTHRFFLEQPPRDGRAVLAGPEAHHLAHVLRAKPGDAALLFDGSGREYAAKVVRVVRDRAELEIVSEAIVDRECPLTMTLGVALPKGDRQRWLLEKLVELGVARLVPLETERGVAQPTGHALARLRRAVIEASKQCGRNKLMEIRPAAAWSDFVGQARMDKTEEGQPIMRWVAHPGGTQLKEAMRSWPESMPEGAWLAVGPEGGFTGEEMGAAGRAGWQCVDLGPRILRIETAALFLAAAAIVAGQCRE